MPAVIRKSDYEEHDHCEKKVYVRWVNHNLFTSRSLDSYLPLDPDGEDIFDAINDGLIYCETINEVFPKSIDVRVLVVGSHTSKEERIKNLQLAFETARSYGCQIDNLRLNDVFTGVRQSILELFWQIFYIGLVTPINLENFPNIEILREQNESKSHLRKMKPEDLLIRYVNQETCLTDPFCKEFKSFQDDMSDGCIYATLLDTFADQEKVSLAHFASAIIKEKNDKIRAEMLLENSDCLRIKGFLIPELMNSRCSDNAAYKMNLLNMAVLFHKYGLENPKLESRVSTQYDMGTEKLVKESNIERLCRIFLNFLTVKPLVTNLCNDCKNGLIFAQVMKLFSPEIFKKDKFIEEFDDEQIESKRIHNIAIIKHRFGKFDSIPVSDFHAEYVQAGRKKPICGILFNLMLYWAINIDKNDNESDKNSNDSDEKLIRKFSEKELLMWVNSLNSDYNLHSFRDNKIIERNILANVIDIKFPNSINWCYLNELPNRIKRAIYYVNVARREGYPMFIHPDMLACGDQRSTILAFTILKEKTPKNYKNICPD